MEPSASVTEKFKTFVIPAVITVSSCESCSSSMTLVLRFYFASTWFVYDAISPLLCVPVHKQVALGNQFPQCAFYDVFRAREAVMAILLSRT